MIEEYLTDYVLDWSKDHLSKPPLPSARSRPYNGTLLTLDSTPPPPLTYPSDVTHSRSTQTDDGLPGPNRILSLPLEIVSSIIEQAALSSMTDDFELVKELCIDCLRPEQSTQQTFDLYPKLMKKFNAVCTSCAPVCRLFHALVVPLIWREPFFSTEATGVPAFIELLPQTSKVAAPSSLPPLQPFQTYVRVFSAISSSIFPGVPALLLQCLPLLPRLTTLQLGCTSADIPLRNLRQIALAIPPSVKRLPNVLMRADEKAGKAVDRLSALLSLASRCETLQELDITWGHAMVKQLDHLLFVLRLQGLQLVPGGVDGTGGVTMRGAALRSFSLNECEVTVGFLQALPEVAPLLASFHLELGTKLLPGRKGVASFDVETFIARLPQLDRLSWTPAPENVTVTGTLDDLLDTHPSMKALQVFIDDISTGFLSSLSSPTSPRPLRCLVLCASTDDLSTLLVLRRPWRIRKMAKIVASYGEMMGGYAGLQEQMQLDLWRRADLDTVTHRAPWINC